MVRLLSILLTVAGAASSFGAGAPYINRGKVVDPPNIDAPSFENLGVFQVGNALAPWTPINTRAFTNRNLMSGSPGFHFQTLVPFTDAKPCVSDDCDPYEDADSFENSSAGVIVAGSAFAGGFTTNLVSILSTNESSLIQVNAKVIKSQGLMEVGPFGLVSLQGTNSDINLSGGLLMVDPLNGSNVGSDLFSLITTNYVPVTGIRNKGWGAGQDTNFVPGNVILAVNPPILSLGPYSITNTEIGNAIQWCTTSQDAINPSTFVFVNSFSPTNRTVQLVAVLLSDVGVSADVRFVPQFYGGIPFDRFQPFIPIVRLSTVGKASGRIPAFNHEIFLVDSYAQLADQTMRLNTRDDGFQPGNFRLYRGLSFFDSIPFKGSRPANFEAIPDRANFPLNPLLFDNIQFTNKLVTNSYTTMAITIDPNASRLPNLPGITQQQAPGRIEIKADSLKLTGASIRGEGLVKIDSKNITDSKGLVIDSPFVELNVKSPNTLDISAIRPVIERLGGNLFAFSSAWTNTSVEVRGGVTNNVEVRFHMLFVDASGMVSKSPSLISKLTAEASPVNGSIYMTNGGNLSGDFLFNTASLTISNALTLGTNAVWSPLTVTNLINLTNYGTIQGPGLFQFTGTGDSAYGTMVNNGLISGFAHNINAANFENSGSIVCTQAEVNLVTDFCYGFEYLVTNTGPSVGALTIRSTQARLNKGLLGTLGEVRINAETLKMNSSTINADQGVVLVATKAITDASKDSGNEINTRQGFIVRADGASRLSGNLSGTRIISAVGSGLQADHHWPANDAGFVTNIVCGITNLEPNPAGFTNNLVIGHLVLDGGVGSGFNFHSSFGTTSAIYVDLLEFRGAVTNTLETIAAALNIDTNFTVYFGDVYCVNTNINAESVDDLGRAQGLLAGRIRWAPSYAGPRSGINVPTSYEGAVPASPTALVNRAYRYSNRYDADCDGIPNVFDEFPTNPESVPLPPNPAIARSVGPDGKARLTLSWQGVPNRVYRIERTTTLVDPTWTFVENVSSPSTPSLLKYGNLPSAPETQQFYRIRLLP